MIDLDFSSKYSYLFSLGFNIIFSSPVSNLYGFVNIVWSIFLATKTTQLSPFSPIKK